MVVDTSPPPSCVLDVAASNDERLLGSGAALTSAWKIRAAAIERKLWDILFA